MLPTADHSCLVLVRREGHSARKEARMDVQTRRKAGVGSVVPKIRALVLRRDAAAGVIVTEMVCDKVRLPNLGHVLLVKKIARCR